MNSQFYNDVIYNDIAYLKKIHVGYKNLYVSGAIPVSSNVVENLHSHNIDVVVSLTEYKLLSLTNPNIPCTIVYKHYKSYDLPDFIISELFDPIYQDIKPYMHKNILFHCNEGKSRSITVLISVVLNMIAKHMKPTYCYTDLILDEVRKNRKYAEPNRGFMKQLYIYEDKIKCRTTYNQPDDTTPGVL